jgi:L-fucose isomerase-like protein
MTAIYTITSGLHDEAAVKAVSDEFLQSIFPDGGYKFKGADFSTFGLEADLNIIYIRTGGAEGIFKELLPGMLDAGVGFFTLLASGKSNSLAASLEILSYLRQNGLKGEVLHGSPEYISRRIALLEKVAVARATLSGTTIGIIGKPSDWLISSTWDADALLDKLGLSLVDIPMEDLLAAIDREQAMLVQPPFFRAADKPFACPPQVRAALPDAVRIYQALKALVDDRGLGALTIRCFDLLTSVRNTGCYALAQLNTEGISSSCEGDVPALLSMMVARALTGRTGFQANPASIDAETGEMLFAHCTIPFDLVDEFNYDTHFESGIGVGIHGHYPEGPVTVFKLSGSLDRAFIAEGELFRNQYEANLCRTQVWLRLAPDDARYFLTDPIGNHHIIIPGHHAALLRVFCNSLDIK